MSPHPVLKLGCGPPDGYLGRREGKFDASRVQEGARRYPMFWRSLPGLKRMVRPGGMRTSLPVRGLRPMPRLRGLTWKTPQPRSPIRSPRCMDIRIASKTASTATSALTLVISAILDTSLTMSTLIMRGAPVVTSIELTTYAVKAAPGRGGRRLTTRSVRQDGGEA